MAPHRRSLFRIGKSNFAVFTYTLAIVLCLTLFGCSAVLRHLPTASSESRKLHELFESYFEAYLTLFPTFATEIGDHRYDDQLEIAISEEHIGAQRRLFQHALDRVAEIQLDEIDPKERLYR